MDNKEIVLETYKVLGESNYKDFGLLMKQIKRIGRVQFVGLRDDVMARDFYLKNKMKYFIACVLRVTLQSEKNEKFLDMKNRLSGMKKIEMTNEEVEEEARELRACG